MHSYNAGYIEAIFQIVMAKVMFWNTAQTSVHAWSDGTVFGMQKFKMAANMAA